MRDIIRRIGKWWWTWLTVWMPDLIWPEQEPVPAEPVEEERGFEVVTKDEVK